MSHPSKHDLGGIALPDSELAATIRRFSSHRHREPCVLGNCRGEVTMAKLTTAKKKAEPNKEFGLPEQRKYPMPDASHARNAKARASQMEHQGRLSAADKKKIDTKADRILDK
jgi:hypothetical protein